MEKRVVVRKRVPIKNTSEEKIFDRKIGEISLRQNNENFFICLRNYLILAIYPRHLIGVTPLNAYWNYRYKIYYGSLFVDVVDVEDSYAEDPPASSWKRIIIQQLKNGKFQVIKHVGKGAMESSKNKETGEITVHSEHILEIISEENIHLFMLEYFGIEKFFWMISREEQKKLCPHIIFSESPTWEG